MTEDNQIKLRARIEKLEAALREIAADGIENGRDTFVLLAKAALEDK